jgi:hypothetical protein
MPALPDVPVRADRVEPKLSNMTTGPNPLAGFAKLVDPNSLYPTPQMVSVPFCVKKCFLTSLRVT